MATNWKTPSISDLSAFMNAAVLNGAQASSTIQERVLGFQVAKIRGTILNAGRCPLAVTAGTVPPEAEEHALVLAVRALTAGSPLLAPVVEAGAGKTGFGRAVDDAEEWLKSVRKGQSVTPATDPTGADGVTAVSAVNPAAASVRSGSITPEAELLTEPLVATETTSDSETGALAGMGYWIPTVGLNPNGIITATRPAFAYDNAGAIWIKTGEGTTNTGWEQRL